MGAVALSMAISSFTFILDYIDGVDVVKVKKQVKAATKRGDAGASGVTAQVAQGESLLAAILSVLGAGAASVSLYGGLRSRRISRRSKIWLAGLGILLGLVSVFLMRDILLFVVRLVI